MKREDKIIKVHRSVSDAATYGVPIIASRELLLINVVSDLRFDGFHIVRKRDFERTRRNKYEKATETMFRKLRLKSSNLPISIDLTSMATAIGSLMKWDSNVIIEDEKGDDFYLGRILGCNEVACRFRYLSADWKWDKRESIISIPKVTRVQFGGNYEESSARYMRAIDG
jgi:hypothetical protein